jgi:hypothetical protein
MKRNVEIGVFSCVEVLDSAEARSRFLRGLANAFKEDRTGSMRIRRAKERYDFLDRDGLCSYRSALRDAISAGIVKFVEPSGIFALDQACSTLMLDDVLIGEDPLKPPPNISELQDDQLVTTPYLAAGLLRNIEKCRKARAEVVRSVLYYDEDVAALVYLFKLPMAVKDCGYAVLKNVNPFFDQPVLRLYQRFDHAIVDYQSIDYDLADPLQTTQKPSARPDFEVKLPGHMLWDLESDGAIDLSTVLLLAQARYIESSALEVLPEGLRSNAPTLQTNTTILCIKSAVAATLDEEEAHRLSSEIVQRNQESAKKHLESEQTRASHPWPKPVQLELPPEFVGRRNSQGV